MIRFVEQARSPRYLLLTECSMADNVAAENPDKEMLRLCSVRCPHMNQITLQDTLESLLQNRYVVDVPEEIRLKAKRGGGPDAGDPLTSSPGLSPGTPILLTGGAGFIGSHLAERLVGAGTRVTILDDLNDAYSARLKRENLRQVSEQGSFDFLQVDIANTDELQSALSGKTYEILIHLAARTGRSVVLGPTPVV